MPLYPLVFNPIFKERVWGGRELAQVFGKNLPPTVPIGESWEITDRPGDVSTIANGPLAGKDLHWLIQNHSQELMGKTRLENGRFPLLIKILDAREKLSLQVHPPADKADRLGGEPKTEMWYIADAAPGAELYVGLKPGVTREVFEQKIRSGSVAECFHRIAVHSGDTMFLPSGRVHAIGAGLVIFEIQQNSDTTYRVFDWNRVGLDGKPRALHVAESLESIDFNDFEPRLVEAEPRKSGQLVSRRLVDDPLFRVESFTATSSERMKFDQSKLRIIGVVEGRLSIGDGKNAVELNKGQFCLLPAGMASTEVCIEAGGRFLLVAPGPA
jgi:mannose-6-phosphate isomerase